MPKRTHEWPIRLVAAVSALAVSAVPASAENAPRELPGTSAIVGRVRTEAGELPPESRVVAYHLVTERLFATGVKRNGEYAFEGLPYGYFDLAVETTGGLFVSDLVVNVPPSAKLAVELTLGALDGREGGTFHASTTPVVGGLAIDEKPRGRDFWRSTTGVVILASIGALALLALAGSAGGDNQQGN
jgi:hypothetical protein